MHHYVLWGGVPIPGIEEFYQGVGGLYLAHVVKEVFWQDTVLRKDTEGVLILWDGNRPICRPAGFTKTLRLFMRLAKLYKPREAWYLPLSK